MRCLLVFVVLLVCTNCQFYIADFPISPPSNSSIDTTLFGQWYFLAGNDSVRYIGNKIDVLVLSPSEYAVLQTNYKKEGKQIHETSLIKVHSTKLESELFFNCSDVGKKLEEKYYYFRLEQNFGDSLHIRFLTDSLKLIFESPAELKRYLEIEKDIGEKGHWSPVIPFYREETLAWDKMNPNLRSDAIKSIYMLGRFGSDEKKFMKMSDDEIRERVKDAEPLPILNFQDYFSKVHFQECNFYCWKDFRHGVIEMKSGELIRIQADNLTNSFKDLTNNRLYLDNNEDLCGYKYSDY